MPVAPQGRPVNLTTGSNARVCLSPLRMMHEASPESLDGHRKNCSDQGRIFSGTHSTTFHDVLQLPRLTIRPKSQAYRWRSLSVPISSVRICTAISARLESILLLSFPLVLLRYPAAWNSRCPKPWRIFTAECLRRRKCSPWMVENIDPLDSLTLVTSSGTCFEAAVTTHPSDLRASTI